MYGARDFGRWPRGSTGASVIIFRIRLQHWLPKIIPTKVGLVPDAI
jgi:hypothetical protein